MLQNSHFVPLAFTLPTEFFRYFVHFCKNSFIGLAKNERNHNFYTDSRHLRIWFKTSSKDYKQVLLCSGLRARCSWRQGRSGAGPQARTLRAGPQRRTTAVGHEPAGSQGVHHKWAVASNSLRSAHFVLVRGKFSRLPVLSVQTEPLTVPHLLSHCPLGFELCFLGELFKVVLQHFSEL